MLLIDVDVLKEKNKRLSAIRKEADDLYERDQCRISYSTADNTLDFCPVCGADLRPKHYKWEEEEDEDE